MARPSKYTPETVQSLVDALRLGATIKIACGAAGVDESQFYRWQQRFCEFRNAVKAAEGQGALKWLGAIEAAANDGAWQAAAWKLERRYPHEYGRSVTELTGDTPFVRVYIDRDKDDDRSASPGGADVSPLRRVS